LIELIDIADVGQGDLTLQQLKSLNS
jgi:hypothetical protein